MGLHLKSVIVVHSVFRFLVGEFTVFEINNIACPFFIDADLHLRNEAVCVCVCVDIYIYITTVEVGLKDVQSQIDSQKKPLT